MNRVGQSAEDIACGYLEANGFKILERNWRFHHLEVDIIAQELKDESLIHFIEVKGRVFPSLQEPQAQVDLSKQKNLIRAASGYLKQKRLSSEVMFDIITILFKSRSYEITFLRDAFTPVW